MVSVVVCTYRNALLLREVLATIEGQVNCGALNAVIVVNNGVDAAVSDVCDSFRNRLVMLRELKEPRIGLTIARAAGVIASESRFVAFVDDDVRLHPDWIQNLGRFLNSCGNVGVVGGRIRVDWESSPTDLAARCSHFLCENDYGGDTPVKLPHNGRMHLPGAALVIDRQALIESGWLETQYLKDRAGKSLTSGGDTEMILRILNLGYDAWYDPSLIASHFVPAYRMAPDYLNRLAYGIARSDAQLWTISAKNVSTWTMCRRILRKGMYLSRRCGAWIVHDVIRRREFNTFRRVQVSEAAGGFVSALSLLFSGGIGRTR